MNLVELLREAFKTSSQNSLLIKNSADRIEALEAALREAREVLNLIGWSRHPADLLTVKHAAKYEAEAVQAITKINEVLK